MPYLPGKYYIRVSGCGGDERGRPHLPPSQAEDHLDAYKSFLYATKEEALNAFAAEEGAGKIDPPGKQPRSGIYDLICICYVDEDGDLDCLKRIALVDVLNGYARTMNLDEDFLITWHRHEIFAFHEMTDQHARPAVGMVGGGGI